MPKYLKFWGTRGSCPVSGPEYAQFGGNTSCVECCYDDTSLIIDAGTGIRPLGVEVSQKPCFIHLILTHFHWDHIMGLPFFDPLYSPGNEITIWTHANQGRTIFEQLFHSTFFPINMDALQAKLHFRSIDINHPLSIGPLTLFFQKCNHPSFTLALKIQTPHQTIGYASDNELLPEDPHLLSFFAASDILIHEAQYFPKEYEKKRGWGHTSVSNGIAFVKNGQMKRWLVTHHDPKHTDADLLQLEAIAKQALQDQSKVQWIKDYHQLYLS